MTRFSVLALATIASTFACTAAMAQTSSAPAWTPPPGSTGGMPLTGYNSDLWTYMATTKMNENALRIVDKPGWTRARQAAAAINDGKCGEAALIAANDARLMEGVKRACKPL